MDQRSARMNPGSSHTAARVIVGAILLGSMAVALTLDARRSAGSVRPDARPFERRAMLVTQISMRLDPSVHPASDPLLGALWALSHRLIVPVAGVDAADLVDTFAQVRGPNRLHEGIDISASRGTPVVAAADGVILRLAEHDSGGVSLYQLAPDGHTVFYYAHLLEYAERTRAGLSVRQGDVIAYVGDTGNAGPGNYHLHFEVMTAPDPRAYWAARPRNPYPLLLRARG
ncbi:MAG: M23 family metallopeptidase [Longimicrobiales bacterium]